MNDIIEFEDYNVNKAIFKAMFTDVEQELIKYTRFLKKNNVIGDYVNECDLVEKFLSIEN